MNFSKFEGSGNDFIIIDDLEVEFPLDNVKLIQKLCHRQLGVGADGLILVQPSSVADCKMRIFNSDGFEALMCGNGLRCLTLYLHLKKNQNYFIIESLKGVHHCHKEDIYIYTSLTTPIVRALSKKLEGGECVHIIDTGVPHTVIFVENLHEEAFLERSRKIRFHKEFAPEGVNVNFAWIGEDEEIFIRTYERGVEDETLACGTGAAAVAIAARCVYGIKSPIRITVQSKENLYCYLEEFERKEIKISLRGLAKHVFNGKVDPNKL